MKQKEQARSLRRLISFTWMKGLLLMVLLSIIGTGPVKADTWNPQDHFTVATWPSASQPYIHWDYLLKDEYGADDLVRNVKFYIGWKNSAGAVEKEVLIMQFNGWINEGLTRYNTDYGVGLVGSWDKSSNLKMGNIRFFPSEKCGSGNGSILRKGFYIRFTGEWDIDFNGSTDVQIDKTIEIPQENIDDYTKQDQAATKTPTVTFTRDGLNHVTATLGSGLNGYTVTEADGNKGGGNWTAYIGVTNDWSTQSSGTYYKTNYASKAAASNGSLSMGFTLTADENASPTVYYHKYLRRTTKVDGISVTQTMQGNIVSTTLPSFMSPTEFKTYYSKYDETTVLSWVNKSGTDNNGEYYIFRSTSDTKSSNKLTWEKIGTAASNKTSFTDNDAKVSKYYTYAIMFVPNIYTTKPSAPNGSSKLCQIAAEVGEEKTFNVNMSSSISTSGTGGILLKWYPEDSQKPLDYSLKRYDPVNNAWNEIYSGSNTSYTDQANIVTFNKYKYKVETTYWNTVFTSQELEVFYASMTDVSDLRTSRGNYSNLVKVSWKAKQQGTGETRFVVSRKALNDPNSVYEDVHEVNGTASSYFFDDISALPGMYYMYRVTPYARIPNSDDWGAGNSIENDGFCQARGIISGRVTFGTGTAVEGVKVRLEKIVDETSGNDDRQQFYSLHTNSATGVLAWTPSEQALGSLQGSGKAYTIQMWAKTNPNETSASGKRSILSVPGQLSLYLVNDTEDASQYGISVGLPGAGLQATGLKVPTDVFSNISLSNDGKGHYIVRVVGEEQVDSVAFTSNTAIDWSNNNLIIGGNNVAEEVFNGYVDDVRVWSRCLSNKELLANYDRILSGTEKGLMCYWPLDEGIERLPYAYDYSKKNGTSNGNHAMVQPNVRNTNVTPTSEQLSLYGLTNSEGGYEINGIPFTGDGTSYIVRPEKGIHEFNAKYVTRFVNNNSLTHNGVDFEDVSSFKVNGVVYYENTTIPVGGTYLYVDGTIAARDGSPIKTNDDGEFTVDVPIGDHFISVQSSGHTFADNGRYPADPNAVGLRVTFDREISGLTFYDKTLVTIAGRVTGGVQEEEKLLGLKQSVANIGQATLKLKHAGTGYINAKRVVDDFSVTYEPADSERIFETATANINSTAMVEAGTNVILIKTDPKTGEWSAKVPPLRYEAQSIKIESQPSIDFSNQLFSLDATNAQILNKDSLDENQVFQYHAAARVTYRSPSCLEVWEADRKDASFGMQNYDAVDFNGNIDKLKMYSIDEESGDVTYNYGYPVYKQLQQVAYDIAAYEEYVNLDEEASDPVHVPLAYLPVSVQNEFASTTSVWQGGEVKEVEDNTFTLDSLGRARYIFTVGLPNINSKHTRTLAISYNLDGSVIPWQWNGQNELEAIVLGGLPKGNNFVTNGPDKVLMVLRDPPGTNSSATWTKGSTISQTTTYTGVEANGLGETHVIHLGCKVESEAGTPFFSMTTEVEDKNNIEESVIGNWSTTSDTTTVTTITATRDISTSGGPDFVGANGDVFIGTATNIILGACTSVDLKQATPNGEYNIECNDAVSMSEQFTTSFVYTQNYIENILIPNFEDVRNKMIPYVEGLDISQVQPDATKIKFFSKLPESDEHYGTSNNDKQVWGSDAKEWADLSQNAKYLDGPSYYVVFPGDANEECADSIQIINSQIKRWQEELAKNELAKIQCIKGTAQNTEKENYSFDAGSSITVSKETANQSVLSKTSTHTDDRHLGVNTGFQVNKYGFTFNAALDRHWETTDVNVNDTTTIESFSYTLEEDGDDDYLSVDVFYPAPDGFGPIFYTRAGATCAPYEDAVLAKYAEGYEGFILQQKTLQIEKPELRILDPIVTGVPSGKSAKFRVELCNNSETGEDCYYGLWVNPESNPEGLQIFMDGKNIATGIDILVPAGEPVIKTMEARQTDTDILDYENISLSFYSTSQPDDTGIFPGIYSDGLVSIHFQPSCTDIDLAASTSLVNIEQSDAVTFSMSGYDYTQATFQEIRLQYKGENDANFVTLKTFVKDAERAKNDNSLEVFEALSGTKKLTYKVDMSSRDFSNQTYVFRALAVGYRGADEVTTPSDEIRIVRDMARPQLITMPTPSSGILLANDNITLTFNEDIRENLLSKVDNFVVTGRMNESEVAHEIALSLTGSESTAKTESTIDLNKKPFSMNFWLKYTQDGRILQHGTTGCQFTAAVEDGKLVLSAGNQKITSAGNLPRDKWLYLAISYDNSGETPVVSAGYGKDGQSVTLINNEEMPEYEGNGPIALGGGNLNAMMQELSIWNTARTLDEALTGMYLTKNQYTSGLLGYWQMNEGYGLKAEDRSRNRSLILASENAWFLNSGVNYALPLDGTKSVVADAALSSMDTESYLVEAWFQANEGENGMASILGMKNRFDIRLNSRGALEMGIGTNYTVAYTEKNLYDGQWHHLALNVLKNGNGSAILYLDGRPTRQYAASVMPLLSGSLYLGACCSDGEEGATYNQHLKGAIDEVRVWKGNRTADLINAYMHSRVRTDEDGLVAYYPMESRGLDQYSQVVTSPVLTEQTGLGGQITSIEDELVPVSSQLALANAPTLENVQFHFVASERQISIALDEQPSKIENCNIFLTARGVQDKNGNAAQPISWTVYVQQNQLKWAETEIEAEAVSGEGLTFTAELENRSATTDVWALQNMPTWLSANIETGALAPVATQKLKFTVDPSTAVGKYEVTLYAIGSQNIKSPLTIKLKVIGQLPDWNPVPDAETMAIVGQLKMDGVISSDPEDMVAAFRGQECVGVAKPVYSSRYDAYMITMNVYGNEEAEGAALNYKVYDASTGIIYPSVSSSMNDAYTFTASKLVGSFTDPAIFTPENKIEQDLSLDRKGWKWFSMYVTPEQNTVAGIFRDLEGEVMLVKSQDYATVYDGANWTGQIDELNPATMYKMQAASSFAETTIGAPVDPAEISITLNEGWNWIGYPAQATNSLKEALADADPQDGDIVMSQSLFAIYNGGEWTGSLSGLTPGEGYKYYSNITSSKTFHFQKLTAAGRKAPAKRNASLQLDSEENMAMVATVLKNGEVVENAEVSIYTDDVLCGYSAQSDAEGRHFITIGGSKMVAVKAVVRIGGEQYMLNGITTFEAGKLCGSLQAPFVIDLDQETAMKGLMAGKAIRRIDLYDEAGALVHSIQHPTSLSTSTLPGVYLQHVIYEDGTSTTLKMLK